MRLLRRATALLAMTNRFLHKERAFMDALIFDGCNCICNFA
jgi:hypothetical protein